MKGAYKALITMAIGNRFLDELLLYNMFVYSVTVACYHLIDFEKHFEMPEHTPKASTGTIMYYTFLSHASVMAGEIVPKTMLGRALLSIHILMTWVIMLLLLVPWE